MPPPPPDSASGAPEPQAARGAAAATPPATPSILRRVIHGPLLAGLADMRVLLSRCFRLVTRSWVTRSFTSIRGV
ncbi:hypothetical protein GCM10009802_47450 [Streptomyces synnematoformans]|uniref:Uncharacterized protein n=1 Tax=Streptomyces synnematoformans TaxID=415721 RepID=A0ABN2Z7V1_9ACTN